MPHDAVGNLVQVGDLVLVRARVKAVRGGEASVEVTPTLQSKRLGETFAPIVVIPSSMTFKLLPGELAGVRENIIMDKMGPVV